MANIYESRWNNAKRIAKLVNDLLDHGNFIFDKEGEKVDPFVINEEQGKIYQESNKICRWIWFINDPNMDNGSNMTIEDYDKQFDGWTYISPKDVHELRVSL